ncbi:MAG: hypothetical protein Alpg2KO_25750 [Alphaproteobacteria bacterium]
MSTSPKRSSAGFRKGASLTGYGLIVGLISIVALTAVTNLGDNTRDLFTEVGGTLNEVITDTVGTSGGVGTSATPTPSPSNFSTHTFTTCGQTGNTGPSEAMCLSEYTDAFFQDSNNFSVTGGIQSFTVPTTGTYQITARGAQGGQAEGNAGGLGAIVTADVALTAGDVLQIVVGQEGDFVSEGLDTSQQYGSGGGGSFVVTSSNSPVIIAGGGGGSNDNVRGAPGRGLTGTGAAGAFDKCGVGGGFSGTSSTNDFCGDAGAHGQSFLDGAVGGVGDCDNTHGQIGYGGFGGGGGANDWNCSGGGGGYDGGDSHNSPTTAGSLDAGGSSFAIGTNQSVTSDNSSGNSGHGSVVITLQ